MCKCTPEIRTPFCGKPGCEAPEQQKRQTVADITRNAMTAINGAARVVEKALVGKRVRVISDHNGQPHGRSKKSWRGEVRAIKHVHINVHDGIQLVLEGHEWECFIRAEEVELVDANDPKVKPYPYEETEAFLGLAPTKNSVETEPEGRGVRDNPPPHASSSSKGADTHSRLSESGAANVAKPYDDPTAHRVADLRAQPQPANEKYVACDGCGMEATGRCPYCQALSCDGCATCEHHPGASPEWRRPVETSEGRHE